MSGGHRRHATGWGSKFLNEQQIWFHTRNDEYCIHGIHCMELNKISKIIYVEQFIYIYMLLQVWKSQKTYAVRWVNIGSQHLIIFQALKINNSSIVYTYAWKYHYHRYNLFILTIIKNLNCNYNQVSHILFWYGLPNTSEIFQVTVNIMDNWAWWWSTSPPSLGGHCASSFDCHLVDRHHITIGSFWLAKSTNCGQYNMILKTQAVDYVTTCKIIVVSI